MNRIASVMAVQARDRGTWFFAPAFTLGALFAIGWCVILLRDVLMGGINDAFTPAVAAVYIVLMVGAIGSIGGTFPFAVGFGAGRRDYLLGTLAMAVAASAGWALVLGLLSLVEAHLIPYWGVGMHLFHLPWFSDGTALRHFCWTPGPICAQADPDYVRGSTPLAQFWAYFVLMLFMSVLGLLFGSIYQRFGRMGIYSFLVIAWLLLSAFILASIVWSWWGAIFGWLAGQTAAGFFTWLVPLIALGALASYGLLRKAAA